MPSTPSLAVIWGVGYCVIACLGGAGARPDRAGDARTGQMAEFDAARDLAQPVPPRERWSRALAPL